MEKEKSLAIRPVMELKNAQATFKDFENIKKEVLTPYVDGNNTGDFSLISGKQFINKSGWRKIKTIFGFSEEIISSRREVDKDGVIRWIYRVRVSSQNGIHAEAEASCDTREDYAFRNKERTIMKPENMIMAMAQTRAFNRAISDLVGGGEASAEDENTSAKPGSFGQDVKVPNKCGVCEAGITEAEKSYSIKRYNKTLCRKCQQQEDKRRQK